MKRFLILLSISLWPVTTQAQSPDFLLANEAFQAGNLEQAIKLYNLSLNVQESAAQHFNLGNAYFFNDQLGQARLHFMKAKTLDPTNPDINANLSLTLNKLQLPENNDSIIEQLAFFVSANTWSILFMISLWTTVALLLLHKVFSIPTLVRATLLPIGVCILIPSLIALSYFHFQKDIGVILKPDTPIHIAPADTSPITGYANNGTLAKFLQQHNEFTLISNNKNQKGWIAKEDFQKIYE